MNRITAAGLSAVLIAFPTISIAQDDGAQAAYAFVTYFECDPAKEFRADEIIERSFAPHYNAALCSGKMGSNRGIRRLQETSVRPCGAVSRDGTSKLSKIQTPTQSTTLARR